MLEQIRRTVAQIPRGKVASYGEVADRAGFPGRARQVVWALHGSGDRLPWHRVVGAGGRILLPGEHGLEQRLRLEAEGVRFRGGRVRIEEHRWGKVPTRRGRTGRTNVKRSVKRSPR